MKPKQQCIRDLVVDGTGRLQTFDYMAALSLHAIPTLADWSTSVMLVNESIVQVPKQYIGAME